MNIKTLVIETSNTYFSNTGLILLGISLALIANSYYSISPTFDYIYDNLFIGIIGIGTGIAFILLGKKKKKIILSEKKIRYIYSKKKTDILYTSVNTISTFLDTNNKSKNLLIRSENDDILSFSGSFWTEDQLIEVYHILLNNCKEYIEMNKIIVENELNW